MSTKKEFCCINKLELHTLCALCYEAFFSDPDFQIQMFDDYGLEPMVSSSSSMEVCECGGGSVAANTHSAWCPKWRA
jgi:hypothetical protein